MDENAVAESASDCNDDVVRAYVYEVRGPGGVYVGKTKNLRSRWTNHASGAAKRGNGSVLQRAIKQHGKKAFLFTCVCSCQSESDALICEQIIIQQHKRSGTTLYNLTDGGEGWAGNAEKIRALAAAGSSHGNIGAALGSSRQAIYAALRAKPERGARRTRLRCPDCGQRLPANLACIDTLPDTVAELESMWRRLGTDAFDSVVDACCAPALAPGTQIHHLDGDPRNNDVGNLELRVTADAK